MKIVQITDNHLGPDDNPVRGLDVRDNFLKLLDLAQTYTFDALVLTGDICYQNPIIETYEWASKKLAEKVTQPIYVIPGNHDDPEMISKHFNHNLVQGELYYTANLGDIECLFLDSSKGVHSSTQKQWLASKVLKNETDPIFLFMHHPPLLGLVPHMDKRYALQDRTEIMKILKSTRQHVHVFCGHYHVDKIIQHHNVTVHITPSGFIQIDQRQEAFAVDHTRAGFRLIEIQNDAVYSQVVWLG